MPVTFGPLEMAIWQSLPLVCGGSILVALIVIVALLVRRKPDPPKDS